MGNDPVTVVCQVVQLGVIRYAIVEESDLRELCRRAGAALAIRPAIGGAQPDVINEGTLDGERLARRLIQRRRGAELSQAELARRAGIRAETLNRIEKGRTTPDFATVRKLVVALRQAESALSPGANSMEEMHGDQDV